ncbi:MAG: PRC-barrel domain-containing protein [Bradyrhizobium sp.]
MFSKCIAIGLVGSALLGGAAFAADQASYQGNWRASKIIGLSVYNSNNRDIGSISDVLMDKGGNAKAAVISVGGFLGVGARLVAVPFDKVKFSDKPVTTTSASNAPAGRAPSSTTTTGAAGGGIVKPKPIPAAKQSPWYPNHAVYDASKAELQKMPEFKYSQ